VEPKYIIPAQPSLRINDNTLYRNDTDELALNKAPSSLYMLGDDA